MGTKWRFCVVFLHCYVRKRSTHRVQDWCQIFRKDGRYGKWRPLRTFLLSSSAISEELIAVKLRFPLKLARVGPCVQEQTSPIAASFVPVHFLSLSFIFFLVVTVRVGGRSTQNDVTHQKTNTACPYLRHHRTNGGKYIRSPFSSHKMKNKVNYLQVFGSEDIGYYAESTDVALPFPFNWRWKILQAWVQAEGERETEWESERWGERERAAF